VSFDYEFDFLFGAEHGIEPLVDTWGQLAYDYDHAGEGVGLLLEQFHSSPLLQTLLVAVLMGQVQDCEGVAWQLLTERSLDYAVGDQLDGLGLVVGEPRNGRDDDQYRVALRVRIAVNRSNGKPEELLNVLNLIFEGALEAHLTEFYPAAFTIDLHNPAVSPNTPDVLIRFLRDAKPAGVGMNLGYSVSPHDETLVWGDYEGQVVDGGPLDD
jgi:hypothetical protein